MKTIRTFSGDQILVQNRRKRIVKAATALYLKKGYNNTNVRELCETFGLPPVTLPLVKSVPVII